MEMGREEKMGFSFEQRLDSRGDNGGRRRRFRSCAQLVTDDERPRPRVP